MQSPDLSSPVLAALLAAFVLAHAAVAGPPAPCEPRDGITPVCGLAAPEDIVTLPDGRLLFGQMAAPGGLRWLDPGTLEVGELAQAPAGTDPGANWGAADCAGPPATLLAHGLDLRQREDGRWQLLVVNHGERESVEFFEVFPAGETPGVRWRGCAPAPPQVSFNDVASLADGGFLATNMASPERPLWSAFLGVLGFSTGEVHHWQQGAGFTALSATAGRFPNGILLAPDEQSFYVNMYLGNKVQHFSWPGLELLGEVAVSHPDNASWGADGSLLVASHYANLLQLMDSLEQGHAGPSLLPFGVIAVDPESLQRRELLYHAGLPMGAGTVAVQVADSLFVGSYVGDRLVRIPLQVDAGS